MRPSVCHYIFICKQAQEQGKVFINFAECPEVTSLLLGGCLGSRGLESEEQFHVGACLIHMSSGGI